MSQFPQLRRIVLTGSIAAITATGAWYGAGLKMKQEVKKVVTRILQSPCKDQQLILHSLKGSRCSSTSHTRRTDLTVGDYACRIGSKEDGAGEEDCGIGEEEDGKRVPGGDWKGKEVTRGIHRLQTSINPGYKVLSCRVEPVWKRWSDGDAGRPYI